MKLVAITCVVVVGLVGCIGGPPPPEKPAKLSAIQTDVFSVGCSASVCHGGPGPVDGLDLVGDPFGTLVNVDSVQVAGAKRVIPFDPENSLLFQVLNGPVGTVNLMPKGGDKLPADELDRIKQWIADGALNN